MERLDWFQRIFGFREAGYEATKMQLMVEEDAEDPKMLIMKSKDNGRSFRIGRFGTPSLRELREVLSDAPKGRLQVTNEIGDVAGKHALPENRWATFQVASQFNCLEFVGPSVVPEDGITGYVMDRTQGPACSIACGPATAYRNYFVDMGELQGQRRHLQINNLEDFSHELQKLCGRESGPEFFRVRSGYTEASQRDLRRLNPALLGLSEPLRDQLRQTLRIGVHEDVQVTATSWGAKEVRQEQLVTQVFGSACAVAYNRDSSREDWAPLASLILEASYEATLLAACKQAMKHSGLKGSRKVFLTCLGGGVFGNSMDWIVAAMRRAFRSCQDLDLDVRIVTYAGTPGAQLLQLEKEFQ